MQARPTSCTTRPALLCGCPTQDSICRTEKGLQDTPAHVPQPTLFGNWVQRKSTFPCQYPVCHRQFHATWQLKMRPAAFDGESIILACDRSFTNTRLTQSAQHSLTWRLHSDVSTRVHNHCHMGLVCANATMGRRDSSDGKRQSRCAVTNRRAPGLPGLVHCLTTPALKTHPPLDESIT